MAFRIHQLTGIFLSCWLFLAVIGHLALPDEDNCKTSEQNTVCTLSGDWQDNTVCWVTCWTQVDSGQRAAGQNSYCQVKSGPEAGVYRCNAGQWNRTAYSTQPVKRRKRGWFRRRRYSPPPPPPPPPNRPPYFTSCPASQTVSASAGVTSAVISWAGPIAVDPDGNGPSVNLIEGSGPGSTFREGTTGVRYRASDSAGLSADCAFSVTVTVTSCSEVESRSSASHRTQRCSGTRGNVYGSVCTHACQTGYQLQGSKVVTCLSTGHWSHAFPQCPPVSCGDPGSVPGGQVQCAEGHVFSKSCVLQCSSGFNQTGATSATCESNGKWSTQLGQCVDIELPKLPNGCPADQNVFSGPLESPVPASWVDPVATDNSGQPVTLRSDLQKGSSLGLGVHTVNITAHDQGGNQASCRFVVTVSARTCPSLTQPTNGHVACTRRDVEGSECTVTCDLGYKRSGAASLRCTNTSQWNTLMPKCEAILCSQPTIKHGSYVCGDGYQHPAVCTLTCGSGFSVQPPTDIRCQENATWSRSGSCLDYEAPQFVNGCPDDVSEFASRLGTDTFVTWKPPDVTDNSIDPLSVSSDVLPNTSFPVGSTPVTYTVTDITGNIETCQFTVNVSALYCSAPGVSLVYQSAPGNYSCPDGYVHGAACTVSCTQGYTLVGERRIQCERHDYTHPPTMDWTWENEISGKPLCKEDQCPALPAPKNGALSCHLGSLGWDCLMTCEAGWDIPVYTRGHFYCLNTLRTWMPAERAPDCVVRMRPGRVRTQASVFYLTGSCNTSLDSLRQEFVTRMSNSIFKDACVNVPSCSVSNVKVTCGELSSLRGRRDAPIDEHIARLVRRIRSARRLSRNARATHYIVLSVEIHMPYEEDTGSPGEVYKNYADTHTLLLQKLKAEASGDQLTAGHLNLVVAQSGLGPSSLLVDCPPGTMQKDDHRLTRRFSCAGCGAGWYLAVTSSQCRPCEVGSYTGLDNAASCTPCPPGQTTPSTASQHVTQCHVIM